MNHRHAGFLLMASPLLLLLTLQTSLALTAQVLYRLQLQQQRWQLYEYYRQRLLDAWWQWQVELDNPADNLEQVVQRDSNYQVQVSKLSANVLSIRLSLRRSPPTFMTALSIVQQWQRTVNGWQPINGSWRLLDHE
ncbi:hypothetical protein [Idiomarina xiamenensis]|uniref:Uncharacterized protein n=1 Tax=Idiomarina xiamenensis 10-D-4 TaxID=740709 RepID=K2K2B0_9GAMM|nr:hypothetical protein [Idiomarina xiamenensis]EKE80827.1 hypothetical protein A10D4_11454 [Idiomarina xiamenensis 10-D-4]